MLPFNKADFFRKAGSGEKGGILFCLPGFSLVEGVCFRGAIFSFQAI
jgi:hypothetical protein